MKGILGRKLGMTQVFTTDGSIDSCHGRRALPT